MAVVTGQRKRNKIDHVFVRGSAFQLQNMNLPKQQPRRSARGTAEVLNSVWSLEGLCLRRPRGFRASVLPLLGII